MIKDRSSVIILSPCDKEGNRFERCENINGEDSVKRVKKFTRIMFVCSLVCSLFTGVAYAEDQPAATAAPATPATAEAAPATAAAAPAPPVVTGSAAMSVLNRYIFRGYELSSHSVVFQPSLTINYAGFSANIWTNIDDSEHATQSFSPVVSSRGTINRFDETDLTFNYTYNIDKLALTGGFIYYGTQYAAETGEFYVSGTYDMIAHPTLTIYRDIDHYEGTYFNLSFSQSIPVYKEITLDLGASFGYEDGSSKYWDTYVANKGFVGSKYSAFHDGMVKAGFTIPVIKMISVQPVVQYWFPLSSDASKTVADASGIHQFNPSGHLDDTFVYGINLMFNF